MTRLHQRSDAVDGVDSAGRWYRLRAVSDDGCSSSDRWTRSHSRTKTADFELITLRDVVGALESYEPAREVTVIALNAHRDDRHISTKQLGEGLSRLLRSAHVLNRGLREAVDRLVRRRHEP